MTEQRVENSVGNSGRSASRRLRVDDLLVDLDQAAVSRGGEPIDLPELSFRLLAALVRHAPERVDKDQLIAEVWDGAVVSDETLAQRVRLLRQALGEDSQNPRYITAVRGRGYRLIPDIAADEPFTGRHSPALARGAVVFVAAALALLFWIWSDDPVNDPTGTGLVTLAALPFKDMSAGGGHQFFADGMHDELLSRLASINGIAVISRTSVEPYRDSKLSLPDIAEALGADIVMEGSVRIDEDRLRITVQLIDAATDEHRWAESYDRELSVQSIFTIQQEVAEQVARALEVGQVAARGGSGPLPTDSLEAYNLYLLGRYHTFQQSPGDLEQAIALLEQATRIDAGFAEAYAVLGWAWSFLGTEYGRHRPRDVYPRAREAALRALSLDANLADARTLYADILTWYDWDFEAAEREYRKTVELEPLNVLGYALFLSTRERHEEAIAMIEKRLLATPEDSYVRVNAGWRYFHAGRYDRAVAAAQAGAQHADSASLLGWSRLAQGDRDGAIDAFEADIERQGRGPRQIANLAAANFRVGRFEVARGLLQELQGMSEAAYVSPALVAAVHFAAGDADEGFRLLGEAVQQRSRDLIFLRVSWILEGYRDDPRYRQLLAQVGL